MKSLVLYMLVFTLVGCSSGSAEKEVENLQTEVIAIHDEVMPKMSEIFHLIENLENVLTGQDSIEDASQREVVYNLKVALERAEEGMMDWMAEFQAVNEMETQRAIEYLKKEREKVKVVKEDILSSMANAETFLKSRSDDETQ